MPQFILSRGINMSLPGSIVRHDARLDGDDDSRECYQHGCTCAPTWRFTRESDAAGDEFEYYCDQHIEALRQAKATADTSGVCQWCHSYYEQLSPRRDFEEGNHGPVYYVCQGCIRKRNDAISMENASLREDAGEFEEFDDPEPEPFIDPDEEMEGDDGEPPIY